MNGDVKAGTKILLGVVGLMAWGSGWAEAGGWWRRRAPAPAAAPAAAPAVTPTAARATAPALTPTAARAAIPTAAIAPVPTASGSSPYPMLGTFYPSPTLMVRGNWPAGGGYSPLGTYGDATMVMYGPLSLYRGYTAPVVTYGRGYDGRPVVLEGNSFSTPNRPEVTPVVYPTQMNYFYKVRETGDPPWWSNGMDWIDQN